MRYTRCWNGPRCDVRRRVEEVVQVAPWRGPARCRRPRCRGRSWRVTSAAASGLALIAATTCAAVLVSAPVSLVARLTTMSLPVTSTLSGASLAPGFLNSAVTWSPPVWPHSLAVEHDRRPMRRGGAGLAR